MGLPKCFRCAHRFREGEDAQEMDLRRIDVRGERATITDGPRIVCWPDCRTAERRRAAR